LNFNASTLLQVDSVNNKLPRHVAFIMDGNGRWAKARLLNRVRGHEKGVETVRMVVRTACEIGIDVLTLFAFSTENWQRPRKEVAALMKLLKSFLKNEQKELLDNDIRLNIIGQMERLPEDVQKTLRHVIEKTKNNQSLLLNLALSYGGRAEIVDMVKKISNKVKQGLIDPDAITADHVAQYLYTRQIPDPDLLIRTSGEMRISNFLLWQIAYSEIYVTNTLWPDFTKDEFVKILNNFQQRERRFGKI